MLKKIYDKLKDKKILILGFGREGMATYRFIRKEFPSLFLTIADKRDIDEKALEHVAVISGEDYQKTLKDYDMIIKSPGIVLEDKSSEILKKVTSQTELFMNAFRDKVIGITGTKGKSTTTTLIYHILKSVHPDCLLMGNIGIPAFDLVEKIGEDTLIVYELSCHQLEYINVSPHISVLLNLFEEHLDHYGSYENYILAKKNICKYQKDGDVFVCNILNQTKTDAKIIKASLDDADADVFVNGKTVVYGDEKFDIPIEDIKLAGRHNLYNIAVAFVVCSQYGVTTDEFIKFIKTYEPLPHRLQNIGTYNGITFYDDSISTIAQTTIEALKSLPSVGTLLLGGMDRGVDYNPLAEFLLTSTVENIVLMPDTSKRLEKLLSKVKDKKIITVENLKEAVKVAKKVTGKGKICLLSPAAASYGFFRDFEERGEYFVKYVKED